MQGSDSRVKILDSRAFYSQGGDIKVASRVEGCGGPEPGVVTVSRLGCWFIAILRCLNEETLFNMFGPPLI